MNHTEDTASCLENLPEASYLENLTDASYLENLRINDYDKYEEVVKSHHPGSRGHPNDCRPCYFQSGLCWKDWQCSFCHLCDKPKRKSKQQRHGSKSTHS